VSNTSRISLHTARCSRSQDEDEIVAPMCPTKPCFRGSRARRRQDRRGGRSRDRRRNNCSDRCILEVIEVGVTDGEELAQLHPPLDLPLDLRRPGSRVDGFTARRARPGHQASRRPLLTGSKSGVMTSSAPPRTISARLPSHAIGHHGQRHDRRVGVPFRRAQSAFLIAGAVGSITTSVGSARSTRSSTLRPEEGYNGQFLPVDHAVTKSVRNVQPARRREWLGATAPYSSRKVETA